MKALLNYNPTFKIKGSNLNLRDKIPSLQKRNCRYNDAVMSENGNDKDKNEIMELFELSEGESEGAVYIGGVVLLIIMILFLGWLTHPILPH